MTPRLLLRCLRVLALLACCALASAAEPARKSYALPAGDAAATLKLFTEQSGEQVVYLVNSVRGVATHEVRGEFAAREALDRMLAGTGLVAVQDGKTGALTVNRANPPEPKNVPSRPAEPETAPVRTKSQVRDGVVELEEYAVTGSRMRLNSGEQPVQPVLTYTAQDIERTGASDLGQLFQYIPALTSYSSGLAMETLNITNNTGTFVGSSSARVSAQVRGGTESSTLLLVDGKRVPRTGQQNQGGMGFDLGGIPLSAIERIEVLLDGASAIYGADAINGVINVILKKRYTGTEVRLSYDNTFDKDAGQRTVSLTHGFAYGKLTGLLTLSGSDNNIMLLADRTLTSDFNRTLFGGSVNASAPSTYYGGAGSIDRASGNLPGLTTNRVAIPANSSGTGLTVADYANAGAPTAGLKPGIMGAMAYQRSLNGYLRLGYDFGEALQVSAFSRLGETRGHDNGSYRRATNLTLPAGYPGNPFGVPVRLTKLFTDLPPIISGTLVRNSEFGAQASGKLPHDWRYEASVNYVRGLNDTIPDYLDGAGGQIAQNLASTGSLNQAIAAGRTPALAYDSRTQSPNAAGALDELFVSSSPFILSDDSRTYTYAANADGPVWSLPTGDIRLVVGAEYREEYIGFPHAVGLFVGAKVWASVPERKVRAGYAEVRVPVVGPKQQWPLLHQVDLNFALRNEDYSDVGGSTTPRYGVTWKPFQPLLLRGSVGEGFLVPPLYMTAPPRSEVPSVVWSAAGNPIDTLRGNENLVGKTYTSISGGNPNLRPQQSENWTYGAVLEVPKVAGLALSFDYFDNKYTDRFGTLSFLADRIKYAPETIGRGPNLPGDLPGWPGPIVSLDIRTINIATARTSGYSFGVRYRRTTPWGDLTLTSTGERTLRDEARVLPGADPLTTSNKRFRPMRITTSVFWSHSGWDVGLTNLYSGKYWVDTSNATLSPSRWTDDVMRWDFSAGYDFGARPGFGAKGQAWWRRALADTKWRATIINVLDTEPPLDARGGFTQAIIDIRLRRYVVDLTKRF